MSSRPYQTETRPAGRAAARSQRWPRQSDVRRLHRSRNTPTNGPSDEYGTSSTANAAAIATGLAARSGLNSTLPASAGLEPAVAELAESAGPRAAGGTPRRAGSRAVVMRCGRVAGAGASAACMTLERYGLRSRCRGACIRTSRY